MRIALRMQREFADGFESAIESAFGPNNSIPYYIMREAAVAASYTAFLYLKEAKPVKVRLST